MAENTAYPTDDHIEAGVGQAEAEEEGTEEVTTAGEAEKTEDEPGVPGA
jgi:hypothetical protein